MGKSTGSRTNGELSLLDLLGVLRRRRYWVVSTLVAFALIAVAYLAVATPVYRATAKLRVGQFDAAGPFEASSVLSARLLAEHGEYAADGVKREPPVLRSATETPSGSRVLQLQVESAQAETATRLLEQIVTAVLARHDQIYRGGRKAVEERLQLLDAQRVSLVRDYENGRQLFDRLKTEDSTQASVLSVELGRVAALIADLDTKRPELVRLLSPPTTEPTELLGEIVPPARPARPRLAVVTALALVLGLLSGVILAFLAEFRATVRKRTARATE